MNKILLYALPVAAMLAGCSHLEENISGTVSGDGCREIEIIPSVSGTRAGYDDMNLQAFGLIIDNPVHKGFCYHKKIARQSTGWVPSDGARMLWDTNRTPVTVIAYSPYQSGVGLSSRMTCDVRADQSTEEAFLASDLLFSKETVDPGKDLTADGKLRVRLRHMMSKLRLRLTVNGDKDVDMDVIRDLAVEGLATGAQCDFGSSSSPFVTAAGDPQRIIPFAESSCFELLFPPQTSDGSLSVSFTYSGKNFKWQAPEPIVFEEGCEYELTLNLNVGGNRQERTSFSIHKINKRL